jgi:hypothetical protein
MWLIAFSHELFMVRETLYVRGPWPFDPWSTNLLTELRRYNEVQKPFGFLEAYLYENTRERPLNLKEHWK